MPPIMKLKQRVLLVACLGVFFLVLLKLKLKRDELYFETARLSIISLSDGYQDLMQTKGMLSDDHSHMHVRRQHSNPLELLLITKQPLEQEHVALLATTKKSVIHPWLLWRDMVQSDALTPSEDWEGVRNILKELSTAPVMKAGNGVRGTQLKLSLHLGGPFRQQVVYKPMRYERNDVVEGSPYDGYDRHNGEIAAFHLDHILGFNRAPPVAGRLIDLDKEIIPRASKRLLKTFFVNEQNETCFYGVCNYCHKKWSACGQGSQQEGSVTIWLPEGWGLMTTRHPWQRTYNPRRKAKWEISNDYCNEVKAKPLYSHGRRFLDIMDTAIFDFLIGNADRHHYETFKNDGNEGMLLHLDNAKSFGDPDKDEMSILTPIRQCCRLRRRTYERLKSFLERKDTTLSVLLNASMATDPVTPVLSNAHLTAIDRRLSIALAAVDNCIAEQGESIVLLNG